MAKETLSVQEVLPDDIGADGSHYLLQHMRMSMFRKLHEHMQDGRSYLLEIGTPEVFLNTPTRGFSTRRLTMHIHDHETEVTKD